MSEFIILAIPFIGTSLGSAMVFFLKKRIAPKFEKMIRGRSYDCRISMVFADTIYRYVKRKQCSGMAGCTGWFSRRNILSSAS